jgi:hypothetical protein
MMASCASRQEENSLLRVKRSILVAEADKDRPISHLVVKALQGLIACGENPEEFIELGNGEDFKNLRPDLAEPQLPVLLADAVIGIDQHAQGRTAQVIDIREVEQNLGVLMTVDQPRERIPDVLNVGLIEDPAAGKLADEDCLLLIDNQGWC